MKKLSTKEKAKRYDEAIEKLRSLHDNYDTVSTLIDIKEELENIFPELAESEDERIRDSLIKVFKGMHSAIFPLRGFGREQYIAWIEKQGEQYLNSPWTTEIAEKMSVYYKKKRRNKICTHHQKH